MIPAPTPRELERFRAELARGGLTPHDLGHVRLRARVVEPPSTAEQFGTRNATEIGPGFAPGCTRTTTKAA